MNATLIVGIFGTVFTLLFSIIGFAIVRYMSDIKETRVTMFEKLKELHDYILGTPETKGIKEHMTIQEEREQVLTNLLEQHIKDDKEQFANLSKKIEAIT
jgi:hypothetical protein